MAKAVVQYGMMLGLALLVGLLGISMLCQDIDAHHPEASSIRTHYRGGVCEGLELYFAPVRGTVLVLCGIPGSAEWGGLIYRVTERNGTRLLDGQAYEVTVFAASRRYWTNVVIRDGYLPLAGYPSVSRFFFEWWDH